MSVFFTSDPHFYHANVIRYCNRPFGSVEEMNEALVRNWNAVVRPEDTVYCLGDFSMAFRSVELFSPRLMGTKYLVPGNHDFCHSVHKKSRHAENQAKWIKSYSDNGWIVLPELTTYDLPGVGTVNLSHMPYQGDHVGEERYHDKRPANDGRWLLHGHVHNEWKVRGRMVNVGVDVWDYAPVSSDQLVEFIRSGA